MDPVLVPVTVLPELAYLLEHRIGAAAAVALIRACVADEFMLEPLESEDVARAADVMAAYQDLPLGFVDASLIAASERLDIDSLLTTDRRHFSVVRPRHTRAFRLLP